MRIVLSILLATFSCCVAQAEPSGAATSLLKFAENSAPVPQIKISKFGVGIVAQLGGAVGGIFERGFADRYRLHADFSYNGDFRPQSANFGPSRTVGAMEFGEQNRFMVSLGVDRYLYLTDDGRWSALGGAGLIYRQSEVTTRFYPTYCNFLFCGFDQAHKLLDKTEMDRAVELAIRLGVRYSGMRIYGLKSDFSVVLAMTPTRWPAARPIEVPDGRSLRDDRSDSYIALETTVVY